MVARLLLFFVIALVAGLPPRTAQAQDPALIHALAQVCLPYAQRSHSFEKAIQVARYAGFRRPVGDTARLEDFASTVEMVSRDGVWRLKLEEGSRDFEGREVYAAECRLSSRRSGIRELSNIARRAFRNPQRWSRPDERRWDRRTPRPEENKLIVRVIGGEGAPPEMIITGYYL